MNLSASESVELEIEFPKAASAQEWIPLLVKVRRPDCWSSGVAVRNIGTADKSVQIDLDFLDREMIIRPGEQYRFTVPIRVPTQRDLASDMFKIQIHQENTDQKDDFSIPLPTKKMRVSPSIGKEIKIWFEPICQYDEGTKGVLRIKHQGSIVFENLTVNLLPEQAIWSGKPIVQRRTFNVDGEERIDLVLRCKEIDVKVAVDVEGQRFEKTVTLEVGKPPLLGERTYVFLEPRRQFDGQIEVHEVDSMGSKTQAIFSDPHSMWPLQGGLRYQVVIRSRAGGALESIRIRDIPGMIVVRNGEKDAKSGSWNFIIDVTNNDLLSKSEVIYYDVENNGDRAIGELPTCLMPHPWKHWKIAGVLGATMTLQGMTALTKFLYNVDDPFHAYAEFKIGEDFNLLYLLVIPVCWVGLKFSDWFAYRLQL